jgi:glutaredoxin
MNTHTQPYAFLRRLNRHFGALPGTFRAPQPASGQPPELLILFSYEGCPASRRVRRVLSELDLDFVHRSCPVGQSPKRDELKARGGKIQVPYLVDPNTDTELYESRDIIEYLKTTYCDPNMRPDVALSKK